MITRICGRPKAIAGALRRLSPRIRLEVGQQVGKKARLKGDKCPPELWNTGGPQLSVVSRGFR